MRLILERTPTQAERELSVTHSAAYALGKSVGHVASAPSGTLATPKQSDQLAIAYYDYMARLDPGDPRREATRLGYIAAGFEETRPSVQIGEVVEELVSLTPVRP